MQMELQQDTSLDAKDVIDSNKEEENEKEEEENAVRTKMLLLCGFPGCKYKHFYFH